MLILLSSDSSKGKGASRSKTSSFSSGLILVQNEYECGFIVESAINILTCLSWESTLVVFDGFFSFERFTWVVMMWLITVGPKFGFHQAKRVLIKPQYGNSGLLAYDDKIETMVLKLWHWSPLKFRHSIEIVFKTAFLGSYQMFRDSNNNLLRNSS